MLKLEAPHYKTFFFFWVFSFLCMAAWYLTPWVPSLIQADSMGYVTFTSSRTVGYPAFLWMVKKIFGTYHAVPWIQLLILSFAGASLTRKLYEIHAPKWACYGFLFLCALNYNILTGIFCVMTEALHLTFLMLTFAEAITIFHKNYGWGRLGLWIGCAILVRPVNYTLISLIGLLFWIKRPSLRNIITTVLALISCWLIGGFSHKIAHGFFKTESFLGHNLIGKVAFVTSEKNKHPALQKMRSIVKDYQKNSEEGLDWHTEYVLKAPYYDYIRYQRLKEIGGKEADDFLYKEVAIQAIKDNPLGYAYDVFLNYRAIWQLGDLRTNKEIQECDFFYKKACTLIQDDPSFSAFMQKRVSYAWWKNTFVVYALRFSLGVIWCLTIIFLFNAFFYPRQLSVWGYIGAISALAIQSHHFLVALLQAGLPRYLFAQWPSLILCGICAFMVCGKFRNT